MSKVCIDCDRYFVTTVELLPTHRNETVVLIKNADEEGNRRLVEKNTPLLKRLDTIVETLEQRCLRWRRWDSNPRPVACKATALAS